ncbi:MAG: NAD-dependent epimerase/dehydratase family protein [Rhodocyclaceae bacterium]|nr:NAD-dependent epimerase/dehydratase family protein [Rhodocyclaceae bacterium]
MTRILVTGGAGFIGSNLVAALHARGYTITVLDSLSEQIHGADPESSPLYLAVRDKVRFVRGSVCDRDTLEAALAGQEVVVHLAAETGTGQSMYMVDHYTRVNIQATATLLDVLGTRKDHGLRRLVVASSRSIYGEGKYLDAGGRPVYPPHRNAADMERGRFDLNDAQSGAALTLTATDENALIHPSSVYGITKQVQEQLVMTVCPLVGVEPVALRYQNVYGPGQSLSNPYTGILSIFSNLIMQRKAINVFEDGLESRDFVFIDDVVDATVRAIEHDRAPGQVFNVGSGVQTTVLEVVSHLQDAFGSDTPYSVSGNFRLGDIRHNYADLGKISALLGFAPSVTFAQGIRRFAAWAATQGPKGSDYERSLAEMKERGLMGGAPGQTPSA